MLTSRKVSEIEEIGVSIQTILSWISSINVHDVHLLVYAEIENRSVTILQPSIDIGFNLFIWITRKY